MRIPFRLLAIGSVAAVLAAGAARAETRPRYGDTLRIETRSAAFLTPGSYGADDSLSRLIFDTLTTVDANGNVQPALATSWQANTERTRWQFWLRRSVSWHDGALLTTSEVAQIIAAANAGWKVRTVGDSVLLETDAPAADLAAELSLMRNAIVRPAQDGKPLGTGPYKMASNVNGRITLQVNQDHWRGRAFADVVEVLTGRSLRDQALDAEAGRTDLVEASVEDLRRPMSARLRVAGSKPMEVMALVFSTKRSADDRMREAIALSLDRNAIQTVFLQRQGEASAALLPNWMTGYAFAFPAAQDLVRARQLRGELGARVAMSVGYTSTDALARTIAERVVLNARDAGFTAQLVTDTAAADAVVERITLRSGDPHAALAEVAAEYGSPVAMTGAALQQLFDAERDVLARRIIVPIVQLPRVYAAGPRLRNFRVAPDGTIDTPTLWLVPSDNRAVEARAQ